MYSAITVKSLGNMQVHMTMYKQSAGGFDYYTMFNGPTVSQRMIRDATMMIGDIVTKGAPAVQPILPLPEARGPVREQNRATWGPKNLKKDIAIFFPLNHPGVCLTG